MIILDQLEQLSPEWFALRAGNPGASNFDKIVTTKGERSKQREGYMYQLAAEMITGNTEEGFTSLPMQIGIERQSESRALYEMINSVEVKEVGIVYPDEQKKYHCSPDGMILNGDKWVWGLEMKNPMAKTHIGYLLNGKLPTEYKIQIQGSLLVTGLLRWDFFSYYPGLPPFIIKCEPDVKFIEKLKTELDSFVFELANLIRKLQEM